VGDRARVPGRRLICAFVDMTTQTPPCGFLSIRDAREYERVRGMRERSKPILHHHNTTKCVRPLRHLATSSIKSSKKGAF